MGYVRIDEDPSNYFLSNKHEGNISRMYFLEIRKEERYSDKKNIELLQKYNNGEFSLLHVLILSNQGLIIDFIQKMGRKTNLEFMDIIQAGNIGLRKAIMKFNPEKNTRLSTYAFHWMRNEVQEYEKEARPIYIPTHARESVYRYIKMIKELETEFGREPTDKELSKWCGISEENIYKIKSTLNAMLPVSLNEIIDNEGNERHTLIEDDKNPSLEEKVISNELKNTLNFLLDRYLSDREATVLRERFGFNEDNEERTLNEIGSTLGVTRERVRQIENRAIKKLRKSYSIEKLKDFRYN